MVSQMADYAAASAAANLCVIKLFGMIVEYTVKNKLWVKEKNIYRYRYIFVKEQYIGNTGWDIKLELVSKSLCGMEKV